MRKSSDVYIPLFGFAEQALPSMTSPLWKSAISSHSSFQKFGFDKVVTLTYLLTLASHYGRLAKEVRLMGSLEALLPKDKS